MRWPGPIRCFNIAPPDDFGDHTPSWALGFMSGGTIGTAADPLYTGLVVTGNDAVDTAFAEGAAGGFHTVQNADGTFNIVPANVGGKKYNGEGIPATVPGFLSPELSGPAPAQNPLANNPSQNSAGGGAVVPTISGSGPSSQSGPAADQAASSPAAATSIPFWLLAVLVLVLLLIVR